MAKNKNSSLFGSLISGEPAESAKEKVVEKGALDNLEESKPAPSKLEEKRSRIFQRQNVLNQLNDGNVEEKTLFWVDPGQCRMWSEHDRDYALLDEGNCADLIHGFKVQGKQEFPAIVRRVMDDPDCDYEVICGARRHWTVNYLRENNYPDFKFLIELRDLTDEQAFRLSDIENRDREDISDYERAVKYVKALNKYYIKQKVMAERLEVTEGWLSRYLDLATMPKEVIQCYPDITQIKTRHARELKPLMKIAKRRQAIMDAALKLIEQQNGRRIAGKPLMEGQDVIKVLKAAGEDKPKKANPIMDTKYTAKKEKMMEVAKRGRGNIQLTILPQSGATKAELLAACEDIIERYC